MARIILGSAGNRVDPRAAREPLSGTGAKVNGPQLAQRLREKRSRRYLEALTRLDAGTHHSDPAALQNLLQAITTEFPELGIEQHPLGFVSRCYLGPPYVAHICDLSGGIVEHFESWRPMPPLFERARSLALHGEYQVIEIYADTLRAISADGSVAVVAG